jgi:hypothetical protein
MLQKRLFTFLLVLLLGFAQHGVLLHAISHWADETPTSQSQHEIPHASFDSCDDCLHFDNLDNAVFPRINVAFITYPPPTLNTITLASVVPESHSPYATRAPPQSV